jgi:DNA replication and repair protein RecF
VLQTYTRALAERNALLKAGRAVDRELAAFEHTLAPAATGLMTRRTAAVKRFAEAVKLAYAGMCDGAETVDVTYQPNFAETSTEALLARLESGRSRDAQFRTTLVGPHRDDILFTVRQTAARDFASEGQQRSLALALRLAQATWFREKSGVRPLLLADDVLGELDPERRRRFWAAIDPESQIVATGTHLPEAELGTWQVFTVADGAFQEMPAKAEANS